MNLVIDYIISLSHLYGIVPIEKVIDIYNMQNEEHISMEDMDWIIENESDVLENHFVYEDGDFFTYETIFINGESGLYLEHQAGKPYYIPEKNELLKYKDQFYFEKPTSYRDLVNYITRELVDGDRERAEVISESIQGFTHVEASLHTIFDYVQIHTEFKREEQMYELLDLMTELSNNTRLWANRGFTPNELFKIEAQQHLGDNVMPFVPRRERKIGRNDPCPCGSGKKYKRCCL